ncbi:MAG: AAA family ATPase [Armatimonadetes bacterium]|nr:AAA family ATPase [Armatimonadota bacterium]
MKFARNLILVINRGKKNDKKIDIKRMGLFKDYEWKKSIGANINSIFKKVNIIYGRNYSGKTTLSRVFKSLEDGKLHKDYINADFKITLTDDNNITQNNLIEFNEDIKIRVYNTDFVKTNLSWLSNEEGEILPFAILGEKNIELDNEIKKIETELGSEEKKKGLLYDLSLKNNEFITTNQKFEKEKKNIDKKLKEKAKEIKNNAKTYNRPIYQINTIKNDILKVNSSFILTEQDIYNKKKVLNEDSKETIVKLPVSKPRFSDYLSKTIELCTRKIQPTKPISDLVNDSLLQEWVRQGIDKHKGKRTTCGFCGSILPVDLWDKLDAHFSKVSEDLREEIKVQIDVLEKAKISLENFLKLEKTNFYLSLRPKFEETLKNWSINTKIYYKNIEILILKLQERKKDIFKIILLNYGEIEDVSDDIEKLLIELNNLIEKNNDKTTTLANDQTKIRNELLFSEIAKFIKDIDYENKLTEIDEFEIKVKEKETKRDETLKIISSLNEEKRKLETQAKDESKGAELINEHLLNFFGHNELRLVAVGESPNMIFKITRENEDAKNLSEGECSLISFCYFVAKMEDEMKDINNVDNLIVYIDDPVSSLDSNHIFYMFSLIESVIAKPKKYGQLFISTHNLDFLKYLKRLTIKDGKQNLNYFLIERRHKQNDKRIFLLPLPNYIRDYVTEFNYLFKEIYDLYKDTKGDRKLKIANTFNQFYNIPNIMRKFLEYYLFYKYPNNNSPLKNLDKLFENNVPSLINRVINEYSHLTHIDRGWKPIDVDEAVNCATIIIDRIKEKDIDQFEALVNSLN